MQLIIQSSNIIVDILHTHDMLTFLLNTIFNITKLPIIVKHILKYSQYMV